MATWNLSQTQTRRTPISRPEFNLGRFFARLNGTDGIDPVAQQRQNRAGDGRISAAEALDQTRAAR
jgi:hypothetical protein